VADGADRRSRDERHAPLVLASGSPQRRRLLAQLGVPFTVRVSGASEREQGEDPPAIAVENALAKARAALIDGRLEWVLGCDTIVVLDGVIYGKPPDARSAGATLQALGGRTHEVISGLALLLADGRSELQARTAIARTRVTFRTLEDGLLDWYVSTGEWQGRSGGYAIQGAGQRLAVEIDGEVENVVGLPLGPLESLCPELFDRGSAPGGA
jgi:septum formation protein